MYEKEIEHIRNLTRLGKFVWSTHILDSAEKRNITKEDVLSCIFSGEIIEYYPDDYPYSSCLVFGYSTDSTTIHTVVAFNDEKAVLVTVYKARHKTFS